MRDRSQQRVQKSEGRTEERRTCRRAKDVLRLREATAIVRKQTTREQPLFGGAKEATSQSLIPFS